MFGDTKLLAGCPFFPKLGSLHLVSWEVARQRSVAGDTCDCFVCKLFTFVWRETAASTHVRAPSTTSARAVEEELGHMCTEWEKKSEVP